MTFKAYIDLKPSVLQNKLSIYDSVFLIGSCFSENIATKLMVRKWNVMSNPSGIMFDPLSIERTIMEIINKKQYSSSDLFLSNELYTSWNHHSDYSDFYLEKSLEKINHSINLAYSFLQTTSSVVITLGSAFSYFHINEKRYVANCHKIPQTEFKKELIEIDRIYQSIKNIRDMILSINKDCNFILTISPVRHLRDGAIENNRSKARLIEAINLFTQHYPEVYYFPSYEIVIDVLRDYRFFDIDFAHPNYLATDIVFDYFKEYCIEKSSHTLMEDFYQLNLAIKHRSRNPETQAHKKFLTVQLEKATHFQTKFPELNFSEEIHYFESAIASH